MTATAERTNATTDLPISPGQRQALFAVAQARGLDIDDLRAMTPRRSISALTWSEASDLLNRLNADTDYGHPRHERRRSSAAHRRPRRPKGVYAIASDAQRRKIEALRIDLGWTPERLTEFLSERHHPDGWRMTRCDSSADAAAVIELLKNVNRKASLAAKRRRSHPQTTQLGG